MRVYVLRPNSENRFRKRGNKKDGVWKDIRADVLSHTHPRGRGASNIDDSEM